MAAYSAGLSRYPSWDPRSKDPNFGGTPATGLQQAQPQQPQAPANPLNPTAGPVGQYYQNPAIGQLGSYTPAPEMTTNQYQTSAGGTVPTPGVIGGPNATMETKSNTSVSGQGSIGKDAYETQQQSQLSSQLNQQELEKRAALSDKAWKARFAMLGPYTQNSAHVDMGPGGGMNAQEQAARAAAFGRAKEQAGQTGLGALNALKQSMESSGQMGGSQEAQGLGQIIGGAQGGVNDFTREQLIQDLNRASGIADETYKGNITQRGQDLARQQAIIGLLSAGNLY